jgi:hypothetical protein
MLTFLFWNLNDKPLAPIVANLVEQHGVDVLMLAECQSPPQFLSTLNQKRIDFHLCPGDRCKRIVIYTRFSRRFLTLESETKYITIRQLMLPAQLDILLTVVHLQSKLHTSHSEQQNACVELSREIRQVEEKVGHSRTLVVGDLNMNPFESGMITAAGLNAAMTRQIALKESRTWQDQEYLFFYNPMWGHFGDRIQGVAGNYYYSSEPYWNIFDQVLLRPALLPFFENDTLKILEGDGETSFLTKNGLPNRSVASDHLPILFQLDIE